MAQIVKNQNPPTINRANLFGSFARDPNHQYITQANYPYYQDVAGTPVKSPVALTATPQPISIPAGAISITVIPAVAIRVSDTVDNSQGYVVVPANVSQTLPLVTPGNDPNDRTGQLWLTADSTSGACSFFFSCV